MEGIRGATEGSYGQAAARPNNLHERQPLLRRVRHLGQVALDVCPLLLMVSAEPELVGRIRTYQVAAVAKDLCVQRVHVDKGEGDDDTATRPPHLAADGARVAEGYQQVRNLHVEPQRSCVYI